MSRLHDYLTGKVKRDEEKKKRDAVIEEQKKFERLFQLPEEIICLPEDILRRKR